MEATTKFNRMTKEELEHYWREVFVPRGDVAGWSESDWSELGAWQTAWDRVK